MALPLAAIAGTFLMGLIVSRVVKTLFSLGIGVITFVGLDLILEEIITAVEDAWSLVPDGAYQLLSMGGIPDALGIILGAFAVRVTMMSISVLGKITGATS